MSLNLNNREVTHATLHGPIHIVGAGQFGPVLTKDQSKAQTMDLVMHIQDGFLIAKVKGIEVIIPLTSVSHMRLAPEPKATLPAKK